MHFSDQTYAKHCLSSMHLLDAISFLTSTGKKKCKAWDTRMCSEHKNTYTDVFPRLGNKPESVSDNDLDIIDRFEVELYIPSAKNISSYSLASVSLENFVCP